jgi:DNA modification methylase
VIKPYYQDESATIYHGDCREVVPMLGKFDLVLTDPPYGHNNNNGDLIHNREAALGRNKVKKEDARPILNDSFDAAHDLAVWLFRTAAEVLRNGSCCCCCCCGGGPDPQFARWSLLMDQYLNFKQAVVWDKGPIGMGWHYRRSYEMVLVAQKGKGKCAWFDTSHKVENIIRHIKKIIPQKTDHPTPKPIALMQHFIKLHSRPGELVLDPFMGAGSTLVAAKMLGRKSFGVELDESYCELAATRLREVKNG